MGLDVSDAETMVRKVAEYFSSQQQMNTSSPREDVDEDATLTAPTLSTQLSSGSWSSSESGAHESSQGSQRSWFSPGPIVFTKTTTYVVEEGVEENWLLWSTPCANTTRITASSLYENLE